jgi:hypothetical protein
MQAKFNPSPKRHIRGNIYEIIQTLLGPVKESSVESRLLHSTSSFSGRWHFYFFLFGPFLNYAPNILAGWLTTSLKTVFSVKEVYDYRKVHWRSWLRRECTTRKYI